MQHKRILNGATHLLMVLALCLAAPTVWTQDLGEFTDHQDIGDVQAENDAFHDSGVDEYVVTSAGNISGDEDAFRFMYKKITGSFSITGNVLVIGGGKGGLMARSSLDANAKNYFAMLNNNGQAQSQYRLVTGGPSVTFTAHNTFDGQLELVRLGDAFYGYYFNQNTGEKTLMHSTQIDMPDTIYVGIATASGSSDQVSDGIVWNLDLQLYDFFTKRELPSPTFLPEEPVEGIEVTVDVREGSTPDMTVIETPPEGWTVSNIETNQGEAELDGEGNIVWDIPQASGTPTMTYDVTSPAGAANGIWKGTTSDGENTFEIFGDLGISNELLMTVYLVTSGDPEAPSNAVYHDLLSKGLTMLDADGNEVFIPGLGYSVAMVDQNNDDPVKALNYDIVIAHENCDSGSVGRGGEDGRYIDKPIPYLMMEQALVGGGSAKPGFMWFGNNGSTYTGYDDLYILEDHPITNLWGQDQSIPVTRNDNPSISHIQYNNLASGVLPLGEYAAAGGYMLAVADEGTTGFHQSPTPPDGAEPAPARRAFLGFHETVHVFNINDDDSIDDIAITKEGAILFQRLVQWLVGIEPTADGTEEGVDVSDWALY